MDGRVMTDIARPDESSRHLELSRRPQANSASMVATTAPRAAIDETESSGGSPKPQRPTAYSAGPAGLPHIHSHGGRADGRMPFTRHRLRQNPFDVTAVGRYPYLSSTHRAALSGLYYGLERDCSCLILTGESGAGKSTLLRQILGRQRLSGQKVLSIASGPGSFTLDHPGIEEQLREFVPNEPVTRGRSLLIIDEIRQLDASGLETMESLLARMASARPQVQLVLGCSLNAAETLTHRKSLPRSENLSFHRLERLPPAEVYRFIDHHLRQAGSAENPAFTRESYDLIAQESGGIPRNINDICFKAVRLGLEYGRSPIDAEIVERALGRLSAPLSEFIPSTPLGLRRLVNSILFSKVK
jgi:general secretion pathway protein A